MLEGQRRYREMMASQYTAGYTDAEEKFEEIIANKDATIADKDATIADKDALIKKLEKELKALKNKQGK